MATREIRLAGGPRDFQALADAVNTLSVTVAELKTDYNALLAKMDADAGITDTNYTATLAISGDTDTVVVRW